VERYEKSFDISYLGTNYPVASHLHKEGPSAIGAGVSYGPARDRQQDRMVGLVG